MSILSLSSYENANANKPWLEGGGRYDNKGPAVAFLIPDSMSALGDDAQERAEIAMLIEHAKTLV